MATERAKVGALVAQVRESRLPSPTVCRQVREENGVSIREAAEALEVSPLTYIRWERGEVKPRRKHAIQYRRFLDALRAVSA